MADICQTVVPSSHMPKLLTLRRFKVFRKYFRQKKITVGLRFRVTCHYKMDYLLPVLGEKLEDTHQRINLLPQEIALMT